MLNVVRVFLPLTVLCIGCTDSGVYYPPPETAGGWRALVPANATPTLKQQRDIRDRVGLDWDQLQEAWDYSKSFGGRNSVLVIRHGWVAGEWSTTTRAFKIASVAKSLTSLAMAKLFDLSDQGRLAQRIGPEDFAYRFLPPAWSTDDPQKQLIRIRHLMTMSSGLQPHDSPNIPDYLDTVIGQPVDAPPEAEWSYASVPVDLLSLIIEHVTGRTLADFFNDTINMPIGVPPVAWAEFSGHTKGCCSAVYTARDLARVGYLTLQGGAWRDSSGVRQIISADRISRFTRWAPFLEQCRFRAMSPFVGTSDVQLSYGYLWWTNRTQLLGPTVPVDTYFASGYKMCACFIIPSLDMVVVRLGTQPITDPGAIEFYSAFLSRVMAAVVQE